MESKSREAGLNRQFRQMKEDLVSVAMRLQVASQLADVDNHTISSLRQEVTAARKEAFIANKQFVEATDAIVGLKREISALKRKLKEVVMEKEDDDDKPMNVALPEEVMSGGAMLGASSTFAEKADHEVDNMMNRKINISLPNGISTSAKTTTFQEWKMQQFLYAPDTLAGSKNHDKSAVDLLNKAISDHTFTDGDVFSRSTRSIAAKQRPLDAPPIDSAAYHRKEGTEEQIIKSVEGIMFPAMKAKNKSSFNVTQVRGNLLSSPPKGGGKKKIQV